MAGIYSSEDVGKMVGNAFENPQSPYASAVWQALSQSVSEWFSHNNGQGGRTVGAVTVNYNGNPNTVFYRSFDASKMLHETLHVVTGLGDDELAAALGVDISKFGGDSQLSSAAINQRLKEKGYNP